METNLGYRPQDLFDIAEAYGEAGRNFYITSALSLDLLVPLFASNLLTASALFLANKNHSGKQVYNRILALGVVTCLSDWFENFCMIGVIRSYRQPQMTFAVLARILTSVKYIFMVVFIIVLIRAFRYTKKKNVRA